MSGCAAHGRAPDEMPCPECGTPFVAAFYGGPWDNQSHLLVTALRRAPDQMTTQADLAGRYIKYHQEQRDGSLVHLYEWSEEPTPRDGFDSPDDYYFSDLKAAS